MAILSASGIVLGLKVTSTLPNDNSSMNGHKLENFPQSILGENSPVFTDKWIQ